MDVVTIDHTLSWEVARVGGMLAYLLATGSVALGLLLSLKAHSSNWPRFITNELHRYITLLTLLFIGVHTLAVWVDPFTGFTPTEVLVPMAAHYRPLWIAMGIVSAYLAVAVWASEYIRRFIGYAWWRRLHYLTFAVFLLGAIHGLGTGSDSREWWALLIYAVTIGLTVILLGWRLARSLPEESRDMAIAGLGAVVVVLALFTFVGPMQSGWNEIANNGNGSGASEAWLASAATATAAPVVAQPATPFTAQIQGTLVQDGVLNADISGPVTGKLQLVLSRQTSALALAFADGWTCQGTVAVSGENAVVASCSSTDGGLLQVKLSGLRRQGSDIVGQLSAN